MSVEVLDHFFNKAHSGFHALDLRKKHLLKSIYDLPNYQRVLPDVPDQLEPDYALRRHQRFSIKCPGTIEFIIDGVVMRFDLMVFEVSLSGFQAECRSELPLLKFGKASILLGEHEQSRISACAVRHRVSGSHACYSFEIQSSDHVWIQCVSALEEGQIHSDLGGLDEIPDEVCQRVTV